MTTEQSIGFVDQIPKGEGRTFKLGELKIAVFHTRAGEVFARQAQCPHRDGPLSDGLLGADKVVCPCMTGFLSCERDAASAMIAACKSFLHGCGGWNSTDYCVSTQFPNARWSTRF